MFRHDRIPMGVLVLTVLLLVACGGDDKGTGPDGNGTYDLSGVWRVEWTMTSQNCPEINDTWVDTVTYTEEDTMDFEDLDMCEDCHMTENGNQYTIDCTCTYPDEPCIESYDFQGTGTISENSYDFTINIAMEVSNDPDCSEVPACAMVIHEHGTKIGEGPGPVEDDPDISLSQTAHNYGNVTVGSTANWTFNISNAGDENLVVGSVLSNSSEFYITAPAFPQTIAPSGNVVVTVVFQPTSVGNKTASLIITSNDPDEVTVNVALSGAGVSGGSSGDLAGTWRVITYTQTQYSVGPPVAVRDTTEVDYYEGDTQPENQLPFECAIQTVGSTWTIDCSQTIPVGDCTYTYTATGDGSFGQSAYEMTYDVSVVISGSGGCSYIPSYTIHVEVDATKISP